MLMKSLYVTSVERYSGKTATCLALGLHLKADGYRVGYLKPLSLQPWRMGGKIADEDAAFVIEVLGIPAQPWEVSPVVLTPEFLRDRLVAANPEDLMQVVQQSAQKAGDGQDILLLEGGGSLREGYVVGLPTVQVARNLSSKVLVVIKYREEVRMMDDILAAQARLGEAMCGILINRVPTEANSFIKEIAIPFIEKRGIPVFGVLPEERSLAALTLEEIIEVLQPELLTKVNRPDALVENLTVGAMTAEAALSRFRKSHNKAVITGGDRTDIQLAALETSTTCLILTGNLRPSPLVVKQAEEFGVPILLVHSNTMETIEKIERIFGKTHLGQANKLKQFQALVEQHCQYDRLYKAIGLE
jgi:BioD-like phosphotransacetylase family protein